jgi:DNA (cytosine-5)-methyltransferase 1
MRAMGHGASHANAGGQLAVAYDSRQITSPTNRSNPQPGDPCPTLPICGASEAPLVASQAMQVRRLTPRECERLQGFRDDYTLITVRGKPAADGPRYKALGNSMAVPVMRWIGWRIECALAAEQLL